MNTVASRDHPNYPVFGYWIFFETSATTADYVPVVAYDRGYVRKSAPPLLEFDEDIVPILGAIRYALRLPRSPADTVVLDSFAVNLLRRIESPHRILLLPWMPGVLDYARLIGRPPVLALAPVRVASAIEEHLRDLGLQTVVRAVESLDDQTLGEDWRQIALALPLSRRRLLTPPPFPKDAPPCALAQAVLERQLSPDRPPSPPNLREFIRISAVAQAAGVFAGRGEYEPTIEAFTRVVEEEAEGLTIPVAWGAPAHAPAQKGVGRPDTAAHRDIERGVFELLVTHRAVARTGFALHSKRAPDALFATLEKIERHFETARPRGRVVWRLLNRLGTEMAALLTEEEQTIVDRARDITIFSNLPLGLARLPDDESPICCARNISYHPVLPLTRALQVEMMGEPIHVLPTPMRVLVAECLSPTDRIYRASRAGWARLSDMAREEPRFIVDTIQAGCEADLTRALEQNDYSFLILSGHGFYDRNRSGPA